MELKLTSIIISNIIFNIVLIFLTILITVILICFWIKKIKIRKVWGQIILFYKKYELLVPNLSLVKDEYGNIGWNKLTLILQKQGLLDLSISNFTSKFNEDHKNTDKIVITKLRKYLKNEGLIDICKSHKIWINLNKKLKLVADVMSKFQLTKENVTLKNYKYIDYKLPFHIQIYKHSITLDDQIDSLRLWGFKKHDANFIEFLSSDFTKIEKEQKNFLDSLKNTIKNNNFLINLSFGISEEREFCSCKIGVFSIYFNDDQIEKIDTIFNWNNFWNCKEKSEDEHLNFYYNCLMFIEKKFKINKNTLLKSELIFINNHYDADILNKLLKIQKNQTT